MVLRRTTCLLPHECGFRSRYSDKLGRAARMVVGEGRKLPGRCPSAIISGVPSPALCGVWIGSMDQQSLDGFTVAFGACDAQRAYAVTIGNLGVGSSGQQLGTISESLFPTAQCRAVIPSACWASSFVSSRSNWRRVVTLAARPRLPVGRSGRLRG